MAMRTLNYAQVLSDVADIKGQKLRNQLMGQEYQENQNIIKLREEKDQIMREHKDRPARIKALYAAGMHKQAQPLVEIHSAELKAAYDAARNMREFASEKGWKAAREHAINQGADPSSIPKDYSKKWVYGLETDTAEKLEHWNETYLNVDTNTVMTQAMRRDTDTGALSGREPYEAGTQTKRTGPAPKNPEDALDVKHLNDIVKFAQGEFDGILVPDGSGGQTVYIMGEESQFINDIALRAQQLMRRALNEKPPQKMPIEDAIEVARQEIQPDARQSALDINPLNIPRSQMM